MNVEVIRLVLPAILIGRVESAAMIEYFNGLPRHGSSLDIYGDCNIESVRVSIDVVLPSESLHSSLAILGSDVYANLGEVKSGESLPEGIGDDFVHVMLTRSCRNDTVSVNVTKVRY